VGKNYEAPPYTMLSRLLVFLSELSKYSLEFFHKSSTYVLLTVTDNFTRTCEAISKLHMFICRIYVDNYIL